LTLEQIVASGKESKEDDVPEIENSVDFSFVSLSFPMGISSVIFLRLLHHP
jgi:hypothetical protein